MSINILLRFRSRVGSNSWLCVDGGGVFVFIFCVFFLPYTPFETGGEREIKQIKVK